jgi:hypothetical protein
MKTSTIISLIVIFGFILASFLVGYKFNNKPVETTNDTIIITNMDTFTIINWKPYIITKDSIIIDSFYTLDSVLIPVQVQLSKYKYSDTLIETSDSVFISQVVSGYRTNIDSVSMRLKIHQDVIVPKPIIKSKRFSVGPVFGVGINSGKFEPFFGLGITMNIYSF